MITGMNHTGFVVRDLDASVHFYRDIVGLEIVRTMEREGAPISQVIGYENTHVKGTILSTGDGHSLELIQYINPAASERPTDERNVLGASHLAFNVDDIEKTFERLVSNGARRLNPPATMQPGRKACYMQDPDGNWIELIEASA